MSDINVEDFMQSKPSLKERAWGAAAVEKRLKEEAHAAECEELMALACEFMVNVLQIDPDIVSDIELVAETYNREHGVVSWEVEKIPMRVRYVMVKTFEHKSNQFPGQDDTVWDTQPAFEVKVSPSGWRSFKTLADLGRVLA